MSIKERRKLGHYDRWFRPCGNCGYDSGKKSYKCKPKCWKCGGRLYRDYSERALKDEFKLTPKDIGEE